jgi:hypothetical protein
MAHIVGGSGIMQQAGYKPLANALIFMALPLLIGKRVSMLREEH